MRAHKFLSAGAIGLYSGFRWPLAHGAEPGPWVEAEGELSPCGNGVHACRIADLPYWIDDELWEVELGEEIFEEARGLVARRGRLLRRVEEWRPETAAAFADACAARARELVRTRAGSSRFVGYADDAATFAADARLNTAWAACAGYTEAYLAGALTAGGATDYPEHEAAFGEARRTQAAWIAERLGLDQAVRDL